MQNGLAGSAIAECRNGSPPRSIPRPTSPPASPPDGPDKLWLLQCKLGEQKDLIRELVEELAEERRQNEFLAASIPSVQATIRVEVDRLTADNEALRSELETLRHFKAQSEREKDQPLGAGTDAAQDNSRDLISEVAKLETERGLMEAEMQAMKQALDSVTAQCTAVQREIEARPAGAGSLDATTANLKKELLTRARDAERERGFAMRERDHRMVAEQRALQAEREAQRAREEVARRVTQLAELEQRLAAVQPGVKAEEVRALREQMETMRGQLEEARQPRPASPVTVPAPAPPACHDAEVQVAWPCCLHCPAPTALGCLHCPQCGRPTALTSAAPLTEDPLPEELASEGGHSGPDGSEEGDAPTLAAHYPPASPPAAQTPRRLQFRPRYAECTSPTLHRSRSVERLRPPPSPPPTSATAPKFRRRSAPVGSRRPGATLTTLVEWQNHDAEVTRVVRYLQTMRARPFGVPQADAVVALTQPLIDRILHQLEVKGESPEEILGHHRVLKDDLQLGVDYCALRLPLPPELWHNVLVSLEVLCRFLVPQADVFSYLTQEAHPV